jgi:hypothetical protein
VPALASPNHQTTDEVPAWASSNHKTTDGGASLAFSKSENH